MQRVCNRDNDKESQEKSGIRLNKCCAPVSCLREHADSSPRCSTVSADTECINNSQIALLHGFVSRSYSKRSRTDANNKPNKVGRGKSVFWPLKLVRYGNKSVGITSSNAMRVPLPMIGTTVGCTLPRKPNYNCLRHNMTKCASWISNNSNVPACKNQHQLNSKLVTQFKYPQNIPKNSRSNVNVCETFVATEEYNSEAHIIGTRDDVCSSDDNVICATPQIHYLQSIQKKNGTTAFIEGPELASRTKTAGISALPEFPDVKSHIINTCCTGKNDDRQLNRTTTCLIEVPGRINQSAFMLTQALPRLVHEITDSEFNLQVQSVNISYCSNFSTVSLRDSDGNNDENLLNKQTLCKKESLNDGSIISKYSTCDSITPRVMQLVCPPELGMDDLKALFQKNNITVRPCSVSISPQCHSHIDYDHYLVPDLLKITECSFYWGKINRYEAERLLDGKLEGTFLLRDSAQEEFLFSVSFRRYGRSLHARIEQWKHKFSFDAHDPGVFTSSTVCGLLDHYKDAYSNMFFEPILTRPLHRKFVFSLQHICRATIVDIITYDKINLLHLPKLLKDFLKEYHYRHMIRIDSCEDENVSLHVSKHLL